MFSPRDDLSMSGIASAGYVDSCLSFYAGDPDIGPAGPATYRTVEVRSVVSSQSDSSQDSSTWETHDSGSSRGGSASNVEDQQRQLHEQLASGTFRWSERFQKILQHYGTLRGTAAVLVEEFSVEVQRIGEQIIRERNLPEEQRTIAPLAGVGEGFGVAGGEKYVVSGIFFKYAIDSFGLYGGDEYAMKAASNELRAINAVFRLSGTSGIQVPLTAVVDYRGCRLIGSSLVPITHDTLVYGSRDGGRTILTDSDLGFSERFVTLADQLNLKAHEATVFSTQATVEMLGPVDMEGHRGTDGCLYVLDLARLFPPQPVTKESRKGAHLCSVLRPELVIAHSVPLSSDAFSFFGRADRAVHNKEVADCYDSLLHDVIPAFCRALCLGKLVRNDLQLTSAMHEHGINNRLLPTILSCLRKMVTKGKGEVAVRFVQVVQIEIVARAFKNLLRRSWRLLPEADDSAYIEVAVRFFSLLLCHIEGHSEFWQTTLASEVLSTFEGSVVDGLSLCSMNASQLFVRCQLLTGVVFGMEANRRPLEEVQLSPFLAADVVLLQSRLKCMTTWLEPGSQSADPLDTTAEYLARAATDTNVEQGALKDLTILVGGLTGTVYSALLEGDSVAVTAYSEESDYAMFSIACPELVCLAHPNLVKVHGECRELRASVTEFLPGGTLLQKICQWAELEEPPALTEIAGIAQSIAEAMRYLHTRCPPWLHRNMTTANVLFSAAGEVKLNVAMLTRTLCAQETRFAEYIPEVKDGQNYTEKSDVFCFGYMLWLMIQPRMASPGWPRSQFDCRRLPSNAPLPFVQLINQCTSKLPAARPSCHEIIFQLSLLQVDSP